jgi:hypothetical protein
MHAPFHHTPVQLALQGIAGITTIDIYRPPTYPIDQPILQPIIDITDDTQMDTDVVSNHSELEEGETT